MRLAKKFNFYLQDEILVDAYQQKDSITKNPQKGLLGMNMLLEKYSSEILEEKNITVSFFKKMSAFSCRCGKNPVMEMKRIRDAKPTSQNKIKYFLAKVGLYRIFFILKNKM